MVRGGDDPEFEHIKKIKLIDKKGALDSLAKHLGMFEKDNEQRRPIVGNITELSKEELLKIAAGK